MPLSGLPWQFSGKESACNAGAIEHAGSVPGLGRSPGECMATHVFLPGESYEQRTLVGYSPWSPTESGHS